MADNINHLDEAMTTLAESLTTVHQQSVERDAKIKAELLERDEKIRAERIENERNLDERIAALVGAIGQLIRNRPN